MKYAKPSKGKGKGWFGDSKRHSLARKTGKAGAKKLNSAEKATIKEAKRRDWAVQAKGVRVESTNPGSQDSAVKKLQRAEKAQQNAGGV